MTNKLNLENIIDKIHNNKTVASIVVAINKNKELYDFIVNYTNFLKDDVTINERLYCIKNNITTINQTNCTVCNSNKRIFDNKHNRYRNWCINNECKKTFMKNNRDPEKEKLRREKIKQTHQKFSKEKKKKITNKIKKTNINKYGVDSYAKTKKFKKHMKETYGYISPFELKQTHDKSKETLKNKYGVDHNFKIDGIQEKINKTFIKNYGYDRASKNDKIKNKIIKTNNKKYGGNSPLCNKKIQQKSKTTHLKNYKYYGLSNIKILKKYKNTMLKRYGYESVLHNPEILNKILKSSYKFKKFVLPSGKVINVQGYEDFVIYQLLKTYKEEDLITSNKEINNIIGQIFYYNNNNKHMYYPDIYIKSENKIIEVKSHYTYKKDLKLNLLKKRQCIKNGFEFEFVIVNKKEYKLWKNNKQ